MSAYFSGPHFNELTSSKRPVFTAATVTYFSLPNLHIAYFSARHCCLYANCIWHYEFVKQSLLHFMLGLWSHSHASFCLRWRRSVSRTTKNSHYACVIRNTLGAQIDWFVNGTPNGVWTYKMSILRTLQYILRFVGAEIAIFKLSFIFR